MRFSLLLALSMLLTGCLARQKYEHPENVTKTELTDWNGRIEDAISAEDLDPKQLATWWTTLGDPKLSSLVERAIEANLDLKRAEAQLKQARAQRKIAGAGYLPTAQAGGSITQAQGSSNTGPGGTNTLYSSSVDAAWEIDIFGGTQSNVDASEADLMAVKESQRDVLVSILAEVALNYTDLRTLQARKKLTQANLKTQEESLKINKAKLEAGAITELDVDRAASQAATTRAQIPSLEEQIEKAKNRMAVLLGQVPGTLHSELSPEELPLVTPKVAVGVPAQVLRRRPDVRRAERQLAAETYRIGVTKAELYPKLTLSGTIGLEATSFTEMFQADSQVFGFGPGVKWNIFSGGRIRQQIKAQNAVQEEALILYEKSILTAMEDVENAITGFAKEQVRHESLKQAYKSADSAAKLAMNRYDLGEGDYLSALDAQRTVLSSEDQLALSKGQITANLIRLYKALGGGWDPEAPENPENTENQDSPEEK